MNQEVGPYQTESFQCLDLGIASLQNWGEINVCGLAIQAVVFCYSSFHHIHLEISSCGRTQLSIFTVICIQVGESCYRKI